MKKRYLITGGAGFIGSNYVNRLLERKQVVTIYDNLSREGTSANIEWLRKMYGENSFQLIVGNICDDDLLNSVVKENIDTIVHLAAQVAVTTSVDNPKQDFEYNALGTFNVLEAARLSGNKPTILYASTNKVYGGMEEIRVIEEETNYRYANFPLGISEEQNLDFHSPYGCSKGCGDQYVRDYARIYGLPTIVMRQSCIYGTRQFGVEDQGWVAWFIIAAITNRPITIYGNGKQVRDILYIDDLLDAYDIALANLDKSSGKVFNIGGGIDNTISIWLEFKPILENLLGNEIPVTWSSWRPGDQPVYVSDIRKAKLILGWQPKTDTDIGIRKLFNWVQENKDIFPR